MERCGLTGMLSKLLKPLLHRIFPSTAKDPTLACSLSANICANFLGLGNAALPLGLTAVKELSENENHTDIMTFSVLNTVPIQLFPATLITLRKAAGSASPYSIILPIWAVSFITYLFAVLLCRFCGFIYKRKGKR
jgi:spore maturation protein A